MACRATHGSNLRRDAHIERRGMRESTHAWSTHAWSTARIHSHSPPPNPSTHSRTGAPPHDRAPAVHRTTRAVVLFTDLDVDLAPWAFSRGGAARAEVEPIWQARWRASIDSFVRSPVVLVASPDHASPVSTGVLLIKPCAWLHRAALRWLRTNLTFTTTSGFNRCGPPMSLAMDVATLAAGYDQNAKVAPEAVRARLNRTVARTHRTWRFVSADIDQVRALTHCPTHTHRA